MSREKLAYIETITNLSPIPGADKIEKATILGWELVVKRNEFKVGDKCVYVEIDAILPEYPCFEFLRPRKFRIRTIKLKGQISQGIAFPLSILKEMDPSFNIDKVKIGQDVSEVLKITKYDPEAALDIVREPIKKSWWSRKYSYLKWKFFGFKPTKSGDFPSDVPKTDEIRVQHMGGALEKHQGELMYISSKMEGTSGTFVYRKAGNWVAKLFGKNYIFQVCSRNRIVFNSQKGGETTHHIYKVAQQYQILDKLKKLNRNIAIQAEIIGVKIQGNIYKLPGLDMRVFLMFDIDKQAYLPYYEMVEVAKQLELLVVPILEVNHSLQNDIKYYVEKSKMQSKINPAVKEEGIVIRAMDSSFSFKSINPEYLLHQELGN